MAKTHSKQSKSRPATGNRSKHVLVVEDDDMLRQHVVQQVASLGYQVSEASDGPSGLEIIRECPDIALLFTDIVMSGGMSGYDLAEAVEQLRPELPILFTSGFQGSNVDTGNRIDQEFELLQKPYRRHELNRPGFTGEFFI